MRSRSFAFALIIAVSLQTHAESASVKQELASIGAGPFEFPIAGTFTITQEGGGTVFSTVNDERRYMVGFFRNFAGPATDMAAQIDKLESIIRVNWERFAREEKGKVVATFHRSNVNGVTVFSMATEFVIDGKRQYYVQFAATDGPRFATVFVEGFGSALPVLRQLEPTMSRVRIVDSG